MFTGLISDIGTVLERRQINGGVRFRIGTSYDVGTIEIGASIAHAGVCLTVVEKGHGAAGQWFEVEAWDEALALSTLGDYAQGQSINLERSLKMGDELGGHLVLGHIDGTAKISARETAGDATRFTLAAPLTLARFIAPKGSVALDGTSLTVNGVDGGSFDVLLIRHTLDVTTWGARQTGDRVNLEVDQMARYAARLIETQLPDGALNDAPSGRR